MDIEFHKNDLPDGLEWGAEIAVDTETMGLNHQRDRLCLVQLCAGDGVCHLVQIDRRHEAVNIKALLADTQRLKIYHYARFDVAALHWGLGVLAQPVWCTKIASKLARTYTDRHGLGDLCRELLDVDLDKKMQSSDWGRPDLSEAQQQYAAQDVLYLHRLRQRLAEMLEREGRMQFAQAAFSFVPIRAALDQAGFQHTDIFSH